MLIAPEIINFEVPDAQETGITHHISCVQWGEAGRKPTLLCAHGLTRNGRDFDFLASALAKDYHVLAPDMRGRGKSQWLAEASGYNNPAYISDIAFILQSLGVKELHWLGTSMGGIMALLAANTSPGLLQSLILNDIGCVIPASGLLRIRDIAKMKTVFDSREEAENAVRLRTVAFGISTERQWQHIFAHGLEEVDGQWRFTYDPAIFKAGFPENAPVVDVDLWGLWPAVAKIPVLLLRGELSDLLSHEVALAMKARHSQLTLAEIEGVGHAPSLMQDKEIALIQDWMSAMI